MKVLIFGSDLFESDVEFQAYLQKIENFATVENAARGNFFKKQSIH